MSDDDLFDSEAYCAILVRGLTPHEALGRLGAEVFDGEPDDEDVEDDLALIMALPAEGGTVLYESNGYAGSVDEIMRPLSAGTVTASVFVNVNRVASFDHYADGREVLSFDPLFPLDGDDAPPHFLADRAELHLVEGDSKGGMPAALELAERVTGVSLNASSEVVAHIAIDY
ncbi:DUF6461 domain-containing protein [Spongiactinospora sp. TRM90649]|uniref:DUF6461 domain-containing protein n=1 Tax=Spongiactinospora sp. TRM90649 TaxID=3031114 RepID=UPI0023F7C543|nr:DUF6461 domain-containing protein [Spongiactinospora sp. TRM90649]MDF5754168.1 DUF6461 domain-containing protein [Spongiactinospora sp. TRM90649]